MKTQQEVQPSTPYSKKPIDELQAMRRVAQTLERQTPAARGRIIAYLNSYFTAATSLPVNGSDPRD